MKLLRVGPIGGEQPAILDSEGRLRDISDVVPDISSNYLTTLITDLNNANISRFPVLDSKLRVGPCIADVGKLVCIGLNYADHAEEAGIPPPGEPIVFFKATSAICGPNDSLQIPNSSAKTDWEIELGVVIGRTVKNISESEALDAIFGYCVANDFSERFDQLERGGQWAKGKSHDSFAPIGPWLVTKDEIDTPQKLSLRLSVNGIQFQNGNTSNMIFGVKYLVSYVSQFMTLRPGDIILTGTPSGVGMGQVPPHFLKEGDVVTSIIEGLGKQCQVCRNIDYLL